MTIQRLKDFTYNTLVPEGYGMSFKQPTVQDLDTLIEIANSAKEELLVAENSSQDVEDKVDMERLLSHLYNTVQDDVSWEHTYALCQDIKKKMFRIDAFFFDGNINLSDEQYVMSFYNTAKRHIEGM